MQATTLHEPGLVPSGMLAVGVHVAFFALLYFGVNWQTRTNEPIMVDVWDEIPRAEAQPEPPPPPPKPMPKVEVKLPPPPPPPPPKVEQPTRADIELKERELLRKKEELQRVQAEKERLKEEHRRIEDERLAEKKRKEEQVRQVEEERKLQREAQKREEALLEQVDKRKKEDEARRKRETDQSSARGKILDEYKARITAKIKSKINIPVGVVGNPEAIFKVRLLPGGDVMEIKKVKSSGVPAYDDAVERAIKASEPLPVPSDPELFNQMREPDMKFRPLE